MNKQQRYRGCLLGMAAGDALGTTLEFKPPGTFAPIDDMAGGGPFHLQPGEWTDDTSMGLCLAESLLEKGFDLNDQIARYVRWYRDGYLSSNGRCFDIGNTVRAALERFERSGDPFSGSVDPYSAGNGSIMRLAPVPMFYGDDLQQAIVQSGESSKTTHGTQTAVDACRYFGALLWLALNGATKEALLSFDYARPTGYWQTNPLHLDIQAIAAGSFKEKQPPAIKGSGYVVASLEAALWAFYHSASFYEGSLLAANLGDDADTTTAVYGQLAGAHYGEDAIPPDWRRKLALRQTIETLADQLYAANR